MSDKLREAAQAAYKAMIAAELSDGSKREWEAAVDGLKAALAESAIKESLTVAEPVAWELRKGKTDRVLLEITNNQLRAHDWKCSLEEVVPLYAAPQPQQVEEQEPFGYFQYATHLDAWVQNRDSNKGVAFYTTPQPQREWVGLTDDEIDTEAFKDDHAAYFALGAIWANKKLREKNG
jgi:hypothetical protein